MWCEPADSPGRLVTYSNPAVCSFWAGVFTDAQPLESPIINELPCRCCASKRKGPTRMRQFLLEGVNHSFVGPDHLFFIIGLLLPGGTLMQLLKIVTAFRIAHSVRPSVSRSRRRGALRDSRLRVDVVAAGPPRRIRRGDAEARVAAPSGRRRRGLARARVLEERRRPDGRGRPAGRPHHGERHRDGDALS